ncbi:bud neck involved protein [Exophiala xenobiotica]|uniref:Bud neck involved protein n=1 Tax=Lithohypha guttulata TaxID=1690604 RepID=A0ABR0K6Z0_9EURO|nr:bud neck involved protein [Lithohypha guttulata]KAK5327127.1 bud neck involved protein [Exophiala xenobiotica]
MLQPRPNSAERFNPVPPHHHHGSRSPQKYGSTSITGYRGVPSSGPVAPYAFTSTPQLGSAAHRSQPSSPIIAASMAPQLPSLNLSGTSLSNTLSTTKSTPSSPSPTGSAFALTFKPGDDMTRSTSSQSINSPGGAKSTPDRYRKNVRRTDTGGSATPKLHASAVPSGSGMAAVGQLYNHPTQSSSTPSLSSNSSYRGTTQPPVQPSKAQHDDVQLGRQQSPEVASRYRRRSIGIETAGLNHAAGDSLDQSSSHPNALTQPAQGNHSSAQQTNRPSSGHKHTGSSESVNSGRSGRSSRPSSARNDSNTTMQHGQPAQMGHIAKQDIRVVNVPNRHGDNNRRSTSGLTNPSPLSRPMSPSAEEGAHAKQAPRPLKPVQAPSPAAEHLAALNQKDAKKSKSKLRRAFSFGSAAELRKVTAQANLEKTNPTPMANKRISRHEEDLDPESARVAAKQEAAGLGESIYSGQGHFFTGSTDNLSISSTASSASIMLRKMGKGMKKGGRSFVGLFRPKSVVGVPAADGPVNEASAAQVSMVTVEAEREKVNVNVDPHTHQGGGTGFPKLERNSIDNKMSLDSGTTSTDTRSRRSIVGGERERAEVLAAVKKGILKRIDSNQSSPSLRPVDAKAPELHLPHISHVNDSPRSSAPSTPKDEPLGGHRRADSVTIHDHHDDYFGGSGSSRFTSLDSKTGLPVTPNRNISFSPRLQFHDTWPSGEYDRRGEIATCNRLTPMLAQQIKEELNSFKMEMEVHESSKIYTHFF